MLKGMNNYQSILQEESQTIDLLFIKIDKYGTSLSLGDDKTLTQRVFKPYCYRKNTKFLSCKVHCLFQESGKLN